MTLISLVLSSCTIQINGQSKITYVFQWFVHQCTDNHFREIVLICQKRVDIYIKKSYMILYVQPNLHPFSNYLSITKERQVLSRKFIQCCFLDVLQYLILTQSPYSF